MTEKPPALRTPDEPTERAARLEAEADATEAEARKMRQDADNLDAMAAALRVRARQLRGEDDSGLARRNEYDTIAIMSSTEIVAPPKKRRGPPSEGPMTDLAKELGFASMRELAAALKEKDSNVRAWNHRGAPEAAKAKIEKLREKRTKKRD